ncbi:hypothetical protein C8T65DRAFT_693758 [Cerioporus squamosus]|nr:hypothetical protein C8T65DRAFT_693758 [Cerioporus squamosus]
MNRDTAAFDWDARSLSSMSDQASLSYDRRSVNAPPITAATNPAAMDFSWASTTSNTNSSRYGAPSVILTPHQQIVGNRSYGLGEQRDRSNLRAALWSSASIRLSSIEHSCIHTERNSGNVTSLLAQPRNVSAHPTIHGTRSSLMKPSTREDIHSTQTSSYQPQASLQMTLDGNRNMPREMFLQQVVPRQLSDESRPNSDAEGTVMQYSVYIAASEVMAYASLDDFGDIIRRLYLPLNVPKWQQLVRAAVLVVGIVEESPQTSGNGSLHHIVHAPESCSPYVTHIDKLHTMDHDTWAAWTDDVMWVLYQLLHHLKLRKLNAIVPTQVPVTSGPPHPLPAVQEEAANASSRQIRDSSQQ